MSDETNTTVPQSNVALQENTTPPDINLRDINAVVQIIDTVARRGAFEAKEFQTVGSVRDRFVAFLQYHMPKEEEANASDTGSEAKTEES